MIANTCAYRGRQLKQMSKTGLRQERLFGRLCQFLIVPHGYEEILYEYRKKIEPNDGNGNIYSASVLKTNEEC